MPLAGLTFDELALKKCCAIKCIGAPATVKKGKKRTPARDREGKRVWEGGSIAATITTTAATTAAVLGGAEVASHEMTAVCPCSGWLPRFTPRFPFLRPPRLSRDYCRYGYAYNMSQAARHATAVSDTPVPVWHFARCAQPCLGFYPALHIVWILQVPPPTRDSWWLKATESYFFWVNFLLLGILPSCGCIDPIIDNLSEWVGPY